MKIPIDKKFNENEIISLNLFADRYSELKSNWDELEKLGFIITGFVGKTNDGQFEVSSNHVSVHRLKGLYIDFRFFWGNDELSNFFKIKNLIGKKFNEFKIVRNALKYNKLRWQKAGHGNKWHDLQSEDMMHALFYGKIIHQEQKEQDKLERIRTSLTDTAAHYVLTSILWSRTKCLSDLYFMIKPILEGEEFFDVPDCFS